VRTVFENVSVSPIYIVTRVIEYFILLIFRAGHDTFFNSHFTCMMLHVKYYVCYDDFIAVVFSIH
jgi:hypothetical protein